jgi:hypothetical protein
MIFGTPFSKKGGAYKTSLKKPQEWEDSRHATPWILT